MCVRGRRGGGMRLIRAISVVAAVSVSLLLGAPALADPPPASNPNTVIWTFHCSRGAETSSFQAISIQQNAAIALQLLDGTGVVVFTHVEVNGQVVYDIPGQADRSDLWTCTVDQLGPGVVA
jgi:hypothetical protein